MGTESRVLVIFCGGTIGMLKSDKRGYVPEPHYLAEILRAQTRFHDPEEDSLFSHSSTVAGFREWSRSGRSSPLHPPVSGPLLPVIPLLYDVLVRSCRPILAPRLSGTEDGISCKKISDDCYESYLPTLVTPRGSGQRIRYAILEWDPLLDSSNLGPSDWVRIATDIELNYTFDAFVVLHGTDTMAYSSSALSFLLEDLGKTVILTGAQIPLSEWRNDAVDNLLGALCIAGQYIIPECCVYFNHTLYRGNRISKSSILDFDAFDSPNFPPLMKVGTNVIVNWNEVLRKPNPRKFRAHKQMSTNVATLRLFPGITAVSVKAFLAPPTQGVIIETFGSGNAPNRSDLLQVFRDACERGVVVVAISQCAKGTVSNAYETGIALLQTGVIAGGDMTPECALTKLGYLLSKPELSSEQIRELVQKPLRGEMTLPSAFSGTRSQASVDASVGNVQDVLAHIVRLLSSKRSTHKSTVGLDDDTIVAAPWSVTNAETLSAESALLPVLIRLSVARNDVESLLWCIKSSAYEEPGIQGLELDVAMRAAGIINCLDVSSGRSPLHIAALHGNSEAAIILLEAGASVHVRDLLGHTALYYAARQGNEEIVDKIVEAGGLLGGSDIAGGFVRLAVEQSTNPDSLRIWLKAGASIDSSDPLLQ
ncbi:L-asparaginase [Hysterangium stoloniferum]|nr:L-asparaginase [Hysterangium stoloniferum]